MPATGYKISRPGAFFLFLTCVSLQMQPPGFFYFLNLPCFILSALVWLVIRAPAPFTAGAQRRLLKQTRASASPIDLTRSIRPLTRPFGCCCFSKRSINIEFLSIPRA
ncbi:hypothetical protein V8C37DRAFT_289153 [Trichoderma ceciliae]